MLRKFTLVALILGALSLRAHEGMWIPSLIKQLNYAHMQEMGLELSAEQIYSVNQSSLKDAIVHFNSGCTAGLISDQGLLLTNHHCGYSAIQKHSDLENNYLKDGFWAKDRAAEKTNPGLHADIVKYLEDVTNTVLADYRQEMSSAERDSLVQVNTLKLLENHPDKGRYELEVVPFFFGNQYILVAKERFHDVRLVGAPPSSIGKYGADTDNWVWPRHTGDFSLFRIYAGADNKPAKPSENNQPYQPRQHLNISLAGLDTGDFTMVYGFPGRTYHYYPAAEVQNVAKEYNPMRIEIRDRILEILDRKMRKDEATRLKYASKYARISNSWKRWMGEIRGLAETDGVNKIRTEERAFAGMILRKDTLKPYKHTLSKLVLQYEKRVPVNKERYRYIEVGYYGLELMRHMLRYRGLMDLYEKEAEDSLLAAEAEKLAGGLRGFYKDFDPGLEEQITQAILPLYLDGITTGPIPPAIQEYQEKNAKDRREAIEEAFADELVLDSLDWPELLREKPQKAAKHLAKSDIYRLANAMYDHFFQVLNPEYQSYQAEIDRLERKYIEGLKLAFPDRKYFPDANSTMRLSYGKINGYAVRDAMSYEAFTHLEGVIQKHQPRDYEFDLPQKLIDLYEAKDYGDYAQQGQMPVCFVASNHTTGGNSGSPVLNSRGELIGLNFDRAWDGVMSDLYYDPSICRNIAVDIRYVLFITDKFAGASHLIEEMTLVKAPHKAAQKEEVSVPEEG